MNEKFQVNERNKRIIEAGLWLMSFTMSGIVMASCLIDLAVPL